MKPKVIQIRSENDTEAIREVAARLDEGSLAALPTETVYGIGCKVSREALSKLDQIKNRDPNKHYTLHVGSHEQLRRYVPHLTFQARKLVNKGLPGPMTLVFEIQDIDVRVLKEHLGEEVFSLLYTDGTIGIRYPDHPITCKILTNTRSAVVAPSANPAGSSPAVTAAQVLEYFPEGIDYVVDTPGLTCKYHQSSTVLKVENHHIKVLREGVVSLESIREMMNIRILFVCTGNTCRSPMAEGIFRNYLANILDCSVDRVNQFGYKITSAGITAFDGFPATSNAVQVCRENGIDISGHRSAAVTKQMIEQCDLIFTMTRGHYNAVLEMAPQAKNKTVRIAENEDIPDPVGFGVEIYRECFDSINKAIQGRIDELI